GAGGGGGGGGIVGAGGGNSLHRYRLSDRRAAQFVTGVADYDVSADGHKLVYRTGGGFGGGRGRGGPGAGAAPVPALFLVDADRQPPQPGQGRLSGSLRLDLDPKEELKQSFKKGRRNPRGFS